MGTRPAWPGVSGGGPGCAGVPTVRAHRGHGAGRGHVWAVTAAVVAQLSARGDLTGSRGHRP